MIPGLGQATKRGSGGSGGGTSTPKTAYFNGNGVTTVFNIAEAGDIVISGVFAGGQRLKEGTHFTKDNNAKTVTLNAPTIPTGVGLDVEYFTDVSIGVGGSGYKGIWDYAANANADPPWAVGEWGETIGGRGVLGIDANYVPPNCIITRISTGFKYEE